MIRILYIENSNSHINAFENFIKDKHLDYSFFNAKTIDSIKNELKKNKKYDIIISNIKLDDYLIFENLNNKTFDLPLIIITNKNDDGKLAKIIDELSDEISVEYLFKTDDFSYFNLLPSLIKKSIKNRKKEKALKERIKELDCHYRLTKLNQKNLPLNISIKEFVDIIPEAFQYPEITCAHLTFNKKTYRSKTCKGNLCENKFCENGIKDEKYTLINDSYKNIGIAVNYQKLMKEEDYGPFLKEEILLFDDITERISRSIERHNNIIEFAEKEQLIRISENRFKNLFNNMLNGFAFHKIILDDNGDPVDYEFIDVNPSFEELTGLKRDDIIGKTVKEVMPNTEDYWIKSYGDVALNNTRLDMENYSSELDKYYSVKAYSPIKYYFVVIFEDITKRRKIEEELKESEQKYKDMIELIPIGMGEIGLDGTIKFANQYLKKDYMISNDELANGLKIFDVFDDASIDKAKENIRNFKEKRIRFNIENYILYDKQGEKRNITIYSTPCYQNDEITSVRFALIDNTKNIDKLHLIQKLNRDLEKKNLALTEAKNEVEKTNKVKTEFISIISHELRTPLNGILGNIQILLMDENLDKNQAEIMEDIKKSGFHQLSVVEDMIEITNLESSIQQSYEMQYFSLKNVLKSIIDSKMTIIQEKNLELKLSILDINIQTNRSKLRQILLHIISNAIKFTEKGFIKINTNISNDELLILIEDSGIGIEYEKTKNIFEPFFQIEQSLQRKYEGVGLGLSICKKLISKLNGKIWCESIKNLGTKFYISIPLQSEKDAKSIEDLTISDTKDDYSCFKGKTILIVEDDDTCINVLERTLKRYDTKLLIAKNGLEALDIMALEHDRISLALIDIQMPVMDGLQTISIIKNTEEYRDIPIIIVTAHSYENTRLYEKNIDYDDFIEKPYDINCILQKIKRILINL